MGTMEDFYRTQFSRYLAEELDLAEYDEKLTSSDMRYLPNTEEEMSEAQKKAISANYARKAARNKGRTASGKVPQGRTLSTLDKYLDRNAKDPDKERPVVVIASNKNNDLAVVQLSTQVGKDRTRLKNYQQGQSFFKHYIEIEDDNEMPIRVNEKGRIVEILNEVICITMLYGYLNSGGDGIFITYEAFSP